MNILVIVKQVPDTQDMRYDKNNVMIREGAPMRMNPADECALETALEIEGAHVSVMCMASKQALNMLRELISRGADSAYLLCDTAFAGADTLATAKTLHKAIERLGKFDLIFAGRRAIDGETGQTPVMLAALLGMPVITNATGIRLDKHEIIVERLTDAGAETLSGATPMLVSFCEWTKTLRLPSLAGLRNAAKADISVLDAKALGMSADECGLSGSPTRVISSRARMGLRSVRFVCAKELLSCGALQCKQRRDEHMAYTGERINGEIWVICEPGGAGASELIGRARELSSRVVALIFDKDDIEAASCADSVILLPIRSADAMHMANAIAQAVSTAKPRVVLSAATVWGRCVLPYAAALTNSGQTADCTAISVANGRFLQTRPAFGGQLIADIITHSDIQFACVKTGIYPPIAATDVKEYKTLDLGVPGPRIKRIGQITQAGERLSAARLVVAGGRGIGNAEGFEKLKRFAGMLGGVIGASRGAVDMGIAPYAKQIGLTGQSVRPDIYIAVGISGAVQHIAGFSQGAAAVIAINNDPNAAIFDYADYGIVGDWKEVIRDIERSIDNEL